MSKTVIIVESPAKAKTIASILKDRNSKKKYEVVASKGHVRDLPKSKFGVDIENNFTPEYITIRGKATLLNDIKKKIKDADKVLLATDPDREGEAISWHIAQSLGFDENLRNRVSFYEITKDAVRKAVDNPQKINLDLVDAQQARRVLDRVVGYKLSPFLWKKVQRGLSAGRVQSVAVKLIVDRERERRAFIPEEYWDLHLKLKSPSGEKFNGILTHIGRKKADKLSPDVTKQAEQDLKGQILTVDKVEENMRKRNPNQPFITSTLQQAASSQLGFSARKTMQVAQSLYEGRSMGDDTAGLITYMRTDSYSLSNEILNAAREYISSRYGAENHKRTVYKSAKSAQEAHEAIRPTDLNRTPEAIEKYLTKDEAALYALIYRRFIASQMAPAVLKQKSAELSHDKYRIGVTVSNIVSPGFLLADEEDLKKQLKDEERFPDIKTGDAVKIESLKSKQHFTEPPARYTEATLIRELEALGIGRPSTYAPTLATINKRGYIKTEKRTLVPEQLAEVVTDILDQFFPSIMDIEFTAKMEDILDDIAEGKIVWQKVMSDFYHDFSQELTTAEQNAKKVKIERPVIETDIVCDLCGKTMVIREGRYGKFLACSGFPECRNTKPLVPDLDMPCPKCHTGKVVVRKTKRGKDFYGCSNYPECDFVSWDKPVAEECPVCGSYLVEKVRKSGVTVQCSNAECNYKREVTDDES